MKKNRTYLIFLVIFLANNCFGQVENFRDVLMLQTGRYAPFVELNIKSKEYNGVVVITTANLYSYLEYHFKHSRRDSLRALMKIQLKKNRYLDIGNTAIDNWGFRKVLLNDTVLKYTLNGKAAFIKHYFNTGNGILINVDVEEESAIIYQLLKWGVATVIGHEIPKLYLANTFQLQRVLMWRHPEQFRSLITEFIIRQKISIGGKSYYPLTGSWVRSQ